METPENNPTPVISVGDWIITLLIKSIPVINIVMLFVWAFGGGNNPNKSNWAKAVLIWIAISMVIGVIILIVFGAAIMAFMGSGADFIDSPQY
jgi:hypothetical protein